MHNNELTKKFGLKKTTKKTLESFEKGLEENLEKIYKDEIGAISHFEKLERRKTSWVKRLLFGQFFVLAILAAALGVIFYSSNAEQEEKESIQMEFQIPKEISSGDVSEFVVHYKNNEKFTVYDMEIVLSYPEGFEFSSSVPAAQNQYNNIWKIGDLTQGEEGEILIKGKVIGDIGGLVTLRSTVAFRPENFSSTFNQTSTSHTSQITSSILTIQIEGPEKVVPDQNTYYIIHYSNTTQKDLKNVKVIAQYPKGFVFLKSVPIPSRGAPNDENAENKEAIINNTWLVGDLAHGVKGEIKIEGILRNIEEEKVKLEVHIGTSQEKDYMVYQKKTKEIEIVNHGLELDIIVNQLKEDGAVNFGDTLNYSIVYKNLGKKTLYNVEISALLESDVIDWETLIDKNFGIREKNIIVWKSEATPSWAIIKPLDEGTIDFSVKLKPLKAVNLEKDDLKTQARVQAKIGKIDDLETSVTIFAQERTSTINTDLQLQSQGRYFSDDNIALGQGPLPPIAGEKTTFRILWNLSNNLHEVTDVVVKTNLAADVKWEDKFLTSAGEVIYNPQDQSVIWKIVKIPPNKSFDDIGAWFDVSIIPKSDQAGKLVLLVTNTNLSAKDSVTKSAISHFGLSITTNLEDDPFGGGRGLVMEKE